MSTETSVAGALDPQRINALLDKVLPFAHTAASVAQRLVGKVRTLAVAGVISAAWLIYACYLSFDLSLGALLAIGVTLLIAPLVLCRLFMLLQSVIGLPQRITTTAARLMGKANEYRELYSNRPQTIAAAKPTLRQLWSAGKSLLEAKGLTDEAREIVALAGGAFAVANPIFAMLLAICSAITSALALIAVVVGLAHLF